MVCRGLEFYKFHTQWHEDRYSLGIPDVSYGRDGINGWIEFKWEKTQFERSQPRWLRDRALAGGHVFVLTGDKSGMTLIEFSSLITVRLEEEYPMDWVVPLCNLLIARTPYGEGLVSPLHAPDQMYPQTLLRGLPRLEWLEIVSTLDKRFPFQGYRV